MKKNGALAFCFGRHLCCCGKANLRRQKGLLGEKQLRQPTNRNNTMPKYQCPFPSCTYETEDVKDELAAVLLSVHSTGTHIAPPATSTLTTQQLRSRGYGAPRYLLQGQVKSGPTFSLAGRITWKRLKLRERTRSYNCWNAATNSYAKTLREMPAARTRTRPKTR